MNLNYISGFLDGDGSIISQIVRRKDYKYGFELRVSIAFYQHTKRYWFLMKLRKFIYNELKIECNLIKRKDNMSVLTILGDSNVKKFLLKIIPSLKIKKSLAKLALEIIEKKKKINTEADFIEVCLLIDKTANYTDSKIRKINTSFVKNIIKSP